MDKIGGSSDVLFDEVCINCTKEFRRKQRGYHRYGLRSLLRWRLPSFGISESMSVADALSTLFPECNFQVDTNASRANRKDLSPFICESCYKILEYAMVGKSAESEFLNRSSKDGYIHSYKLRQKVKTDRPSVSMDEAPPLVPIGRPVLISSAPIVNPLKRQRVDYADASTSTGTTCTSEMPRMKKKPRSWRIIATDMCSQSKYKQVYRTLWKNSPTARKDLETCIYTFVRAEAKNFIKNDPCQMLVNPLTEENIEKFDWNEVVESISKNMPYLFAAICALCSKTRVNCIVNRNSEGNHRMRTAVGNVIANLLYLRSERKFKFVAGLNSLMLWRSGCVNHKMIQCFHQLGISMTRFGARDLIKNLTMDDTLPTNPVKRIPSQNDESLAEEVNDKDEGEMSDVSNTEEVNDEDVMSDVSNTEEANDEDVMSDVSNTEEANDKDQDEMSDVSNTEEVNDEDEMSDVSMSDNDEQQSDNVNNELSPDSEELNNEDDKIS